MKKVKILAIVSALVTALLLYLCLSSLTRPTEVSTTSVLVASSDIQANMPITDSMIKTVELSSQAVVAGALTNKADVIGKIAKAEIFAGEQLLSAKLVETGERDSSTLAYAIEPGMRAISIAVDETGGVAFMITPGNNVDVIAELIKTTNTADGSNSTSITYTTMVLENVSVLAVDNVFSKEGKVNSDTPTYTTLTLQVTPAQAMKLSAAQYEGQLRVILRSPVDTKTTGQASITLNDVLS